MDCPTTSKSDPSTSLVAMLCLPPADDSNFDPAENLVTNENSDLPLSANISTHLTQLTSSTTSPTKDCVATVDDNVQNLSAFVNEVAHQQQLQIDSLEAKMNILEEMKQKLDLLNQKYEKLYGEETSINRKTLLAVEEASTKRNKISKLRDEILHLLVTEQHFQQEIRTASADSLNATFEAQRIRMKELARKAQQVENNRDINKRISQLQESIANYEAEKREILKSIDADAELRTTSLEEEISSLEKEKERLTRILDRKMNLVKSEDVKLQKLCVEHQTAGKRHAAQKLRLRSRLTEKKLLLQQAEEEAAAIRGRASRQKT
ncbi:unnamed protein product [Clavelina lepadiformis]|uniref:Uncharacterized protein n=1 Tax=Clavelina lepadiformis TaxID=159417 RepID=A0ABP0H2K5_CLALP